ncbi:translation initiation factor 3 subunit J [Pelomyxa schiedti]|nr:translation initiation factor 3 subunit J [Pelomyxa schiedti]
MGDSWEDAGDLDVEDIISKSKTKAAWEEAVDELTPKRTGPALAPVIGTVTSLTVATPAKTAAPTPAATTAASGTTPATPATGTASSTAAATTGTAAASTAATAPTKKAARKAALAKKDAEIPTELPRADPALTKLLSQKREEEADLKNVVSTFSGVSMVGQLETFIPKTKDDYLEFANMLSERALPYKENLHYVELVKELVRRLTIVQRVEDVKQVSTVITTVINDKLREGKAPKAKKAAAPKKALNKHDNLMENSAEVDVEQDEYDFM